MIYWVWIRIHKWDSILHPQGQAMGCLLHEYLRVSLWIGYTDGLVQDCSIPIANAMEILQSCTKPSINISLASCKIEITTLLAQGCQPFPVEIQNTSRWDTDFGLKIQNKNLLLHKIQILVVEYRTHPTKDILENKYFFFNKETNDYNW